MQTEMKNGIDFMKDCIENPALYGSFLSTFYADPAPSDKELSEWFRSKGYAVTPEECKKIRDLMGAAQGSPSLHY